MKAAARDLSMQLGELRASHLGIVTARMLQEAAELIRDHRTHCRQQGIDFPVMVMVVVPRLHIFEIRRADLDLSSIRQQVINFVGQHGSKGLSKEDVAIAFRAAWPDLRPGDLVDEAVVVRQRRRARDAAWQMAQDEEIRH